MIDVDSSYIRAAYSVSAVLITLLLAHSIATYRKAKRQLARLESESTHEA